MKIHKCKKAIGLFRDPIQISSDFLIVSLHAGDIVIEICKSTKAEIFCLTHAGLGYLMKRDLTEVEMSL